MPKEPSSNHTVPKTVVEYFAGIGLFRMGLEPEGWDIVLANDVSPRKFEMYETFFPGASAHYIVRDIFDIAPSEVPAATLATCGFPCIDLSLAGNMNGLGGRHSSAFWGFVKILKAQGDLGPPIVLVENVPGWLSSNGGADFRMTVTALNDLGYACDVFVMDALRFTPQSRLRVFLIGTKTRPGVADPSGLLQRSASLCTARLRAVATENRDLGWTHLNIPEPPPLRTSGLSQDVIEAIPDADNRWWPAKEITRHLKMMAPAHRARVRALARAETVTYRTFYRRRRSGVQRVEVRQDDIAGCLRTAVGGSSKQFLIAAGQGKVKMRNMTSREYARLQGVPDRYRISVDEPQALTGLGDAVCVPVVRWIGREVLVPLLDELSFGQSIPEALLEQADGGDSARLA